MKAPDYTKWAIAKLREYASDDPIDRERLQALLTAHLVWDRVTFIAECKKQLPHYRACDYSIDWLYEQACNAVEPNNQAPAE